MTTTILIFALAAYVFHLSRKDEGKTADVFDYLKKWWQSYPKYRIAEKIRQISGEPIFDAQIRQAFWPFWIDLNDHRYLDSIKEATEWIESDKTVRARRNYRTVYHRVA